MLQIDYNKEAPFAYLDTSFAGYVEREKARRSAHMIKGVIPDYAFEMDYDLRKKLLKIPFFYSMSKKVVKTLVAKNIQQYNQVGIAVGPKQYPEIYEMGRECAAKLGIAIPNIYIIQNPVINAFTMAADDISPMVILHSSTVERLSPAELKVIIAHECGHIQNNHSVLQTVVNILLNSSKLISKIGSVLMLLWTRAQEITADRAGMICADRPEDFYQAMAKLQAGAMMTNDYQQNIDLTALWEQMDETLSNPSRILELGMNHPGTIRRIFAGKLFAESELYYDWCPEKARPHMQLMSKEDMDKKCKMLTNVWNNKGAREIKFELD